MASILYCRHADCGVGYSVVGVIPSVCPSCTRETSWTTSPLGPWPFPLSLMDKRFLKSLRIQAEDEH